jgi:uncharacterized protein (TIGR03437 family)
MTPKFLRIGATVIAALFAGALAHAQSFTITTVAGAGADTNPGGLATLFELSTPTGVAVDASGNFYIVDSGLNRVFKVSSLGYISTVAGTAAVAGYSGDGGPATSARLNNPEAAALTPSGNIYIADYLNYVVREVSGGAIKTIAGNNQAESAPGGMGDGGPATQAELSGPLGVAVDASGNVYIADSAVNRIRKVAGGVITTIAGTGQDCCSGEGGPAVNASIGPPQQIAVDAAGNIYFAEADCYVHEVTASGTLLRIAGNGTLGYSGDGGPATSAQLSCGPVGVAVDGIGNIYIADTYNNAVRMVAAGTGIITTIAGNGNCGYTGDGGAAKSAQLCWPMGLAISGNNIYVADEANSAVRMLTSSTPLAPAPSIQSGGVVPIYGLTSTIQPGAWVSIYGNNLIAGSMPVNWTGNYPTSLGGTTVSIDGKPAYLSYASPTLINLEAPDDSTRGSVNVTVSNPNGSATATVTLADQSPVFSLLSDAKHVAGIILRPDGSGALGSGASSYDIIGPAGTSLGYTTVPAAAGDSVVLFGSGFGPTNPAVPAGQAFSDGPAPGTGTITLTINGQTVTPSFAGISTEPGLFQINFTLPSGLGTGDQPLMAAVNAASTQPNVVITLK